MKNNIPYIRAEQKKITALVTKKFKRYYLSGERYIEFREPNAEFNTAMRSREYHGEKKAIERGESSRYLPTVPKKRGGRIG